MYVYGGHTEHHRTLTPPPLIAVWSWLKNIEVNYNPDTGASKKPVGKATAGKIELVINNNRFRRGQEVSKRMVPASLNHCSIRCLVGHILGYVQFSMNCQIGSVAESSAQWLGINYGNGNESSSRLDMVRSCIHVHVCVTV